MDSYVKWELRRFTSIDLTQYQEDLMTYADTVHADKILGYVPTTSLSSGVRNSVEWYNVALDEGIRTPAMESSSWCFIIGNVNYGIFC